jgi:hypothetical protein
MIGLIVLPDNDRFPVPYLSYDFSSIRYFVVLENMYSSFWFFVRELSDDMEKRNIEDVCGR